MNKDMDLLDIVKRAQMDTLLDIDEVEEFEDNREYLRGLKTLYLDIIHQAKFLCDNPSYTGLDKKTEEIREKLETLEELREKSVEDEFDADRFLDEQFSDEIEKEIVKLLYSKLGVGVKVYKPNISGEALIMSLKLMKGVDPEEGRKYLMESSSLMEKGFIKVDNRKRRMGPGHSRNKTGLESTAFRLGDWVVDALQGHIDPDHEYDDEIERRSKKKQDIAEEVEPDVELSDVVLPDDLKRTINSFVGQSKNEDKFKEEWNLKSIMGERKGMNMLFSGPSGTGKTMLSKALANELDKDLYMLSFSDIVDSYYGETEKNVKKIFDLVDEDSIVLVDEAEGLLQRRTPGKNSCDKSENRVVNIILQGMEKHDGMMIFNTNIAMGLDRAVERRFDLKLELPLPDVDAREQIWKYHIPEEMPLEDDVNVRELAEEYEFSGGQIRNVVLNAGRIAMREDKERVGVEDFQEACRKEIDGEEAMNYVLGSEEGEEEEVRGYA